MAKVYLLGKTVPMVGDNNVEKLALMAGNLYENEEQPNLVNLNKKMSDREMAASFDEFYNIDKENLYYNAASFITFVFGIEDLSNESIGLLLGDINISPTYNRIVPISTRDIYMTGNNKCVMLSGSVADFTEFFGQVCCSKYGAELNDVADQMLEICLNEAPNLFKDAGAPCTFGKCNKTNSCGKKREAKIKQLIRTY